MHIPDTVQGVLSTRIDMLSQADKRVLRAAAVVGAIAVVQDIDERKKAEDLLNAPAHPLVAEAYRSLFQNPQQAPAAGEVGQSAALPEVAKMAPAAGQGVLGAQASGGTAPAAATPAAAKVSGSVSVLIQGNTAVGAP